MVDRRVRERLGRLGAAGMAVGTAAMLGNLLAYLVPLLGARRLDPESFGALAAVMAICAIAAVPGLGLQTAVAVHVSRHGRVPGLGRVTLLTVAATSGLLLVASPALANLLRLPWPAVPLAAAITAPVVAGSALLGLLQGQLRFSRLALGMLLLAAGRCGGVIIGLALGADLTGCLLLGAAVAVLTAGIVAVLVPRPAARPLPAGGPGLSRGLVAAGSAILAMFALSSADLIAARTLLPATEAAGYAVLSVLSKGALWAPQLITIMALPYLARGTRRVRTVAVLAGLAVGAVLVTAAALAGPLALRLAGGPAYVHLAGHAWAFAATGALYALVFLLTNAEVAGGVRVPAAPLAVALVSFVTVVAILPRPTIAGIITTALLTAAGSAAAITAGGWWRSRPATGVTGLDVARSAGREPVKVTDQ